MTPGRLFCDFLYRMFWYSAFKCMKDQPHTFLVLSVIIKKFSHLRFTKLKLYEELLVFNKTHGISNNRISSYKQGSSVSSLKCTVIYVQIKHSFSPSHYDPASCFSGTERYWRSTPACLEWWTPWWFQTPGSSGLSSPQSACIVEWTHPAWSAKQPNGQNKVHI